MKTKTSRIFLIISGLLLIAVGLSAYLFHAKRKNAVDNIAPNWSQTVKN